MKFLLISGLFLVSASVGAAAPGLDVATVTNAPGGGQTYTVSIQTLIFMTLLSLLPAGLLMMTAFTRPASLR